MVKENSKRYKIIEKRIYCLYNEITDVKRLGKRNKESESCREKQQV